MAITDVQSLQHLDLRSERDPTSGLDQTEITWGLEREWELENLVFYRCLRFAHGLTGIVLESDCSEGAGTPFLVAFNTYPVLTSLYLLTCHTSR